MVLNGDRPESLTAGPGSCMVAGPSGTATSATRNGSPPTPPSSTSKVDTTGSTAGVTPSTDTVVASGRDGRAVSPTGG